MINSKEPANPTYMCVQSEYTHQWYLSEKYDGMDIRTKIAAMAMQGLLASKPPRTHLQYEGYSPELVASAAVAYTDALINELNK